MSLARLLATNAGTILRAGTTTNRNNDATPDWDSPTRTASPGWVSQTLSSEVLGGRDAQISEYVLFVPAGTDLLATDRWEDSAGTVYAVDGPPHHAGTPRGEHHVEARLRLVEG